MLREFLSALGQAANRIDAFLVRRRWVLLFAILGVACLLLALWEFQLWRLAKTVELERKVMWAVALVLLLGTVALVGVVPKWQVRRVEDLKERLALENEARKTLAQILGGAFVLASLYFAWNTLEVNREGQITERFTRAIDQLGAAREDGRENLEIRLGGIYALKRIARDSEKDHWPIMEILTAYVRQNAAWKEEPKGEEPDPGKGAKKVKPRIDIQAILTVINRRERSYEKREDQRLDLRKTDLRGAYLEEAHLEGANLSGANLEGADLSWARLKRANLTEAHLERANLTEAHLEGADLWEAHLEGANLSGANLEGATLEAHLEGANLKEANLEGANLKRAHLEGADLRYANLKEANLWKANLKGAHLKGARLQGADLAGANLEGAKLWGANLEGARLEEAHLEGADLYEATGLTREQIELAFIDEKTKLPDYLKGPE